MFFFLAPEANFIQHLLGTDRFNTWTRVLVLCLFAIFGSHIQYTINKEREADEALRTSEEKYRSILESVEEGYFETDLLGGIKFFNGPLCRILGYDACELRAMTTQDFTTPETAAAAEAILDQVQRTGEATPVSNYVVRHKDGTHRDLELSLSLMPDAVGRPAGFRWVVRDVTERRKAEEERKKLEAQLQAAQKMEAIGTVAGGIVHDFNNILMGNQGNASLLEIRLEGGHPGREKVKNIEKYVESGTQLSRQLLGFARRGKYNVKASDINDIIEKTASMFARTRKEIRVHRQLAGDIWTVEVIVVLTVFFVVLGCFLDGISMVVLTLRVILPTVEAAGIDRLGFGIYIVIVVEMAQITPPLGFNLFVMQGMTGREIGWIARVTLPFFFCMVAGVVLITLFPAIVTALPQAVMSAPR